MRRALAIGLWCFSVGAAVPAAAQNLSVTVTPTRLSVTGAIPGSDVLFYGVGLEPKNLRAMLHRWSAVVPDTAHSGTVSYDLGVPAAFNAVWIVADLTSGRYIVTSTHGFPVARALYPAREFKRDPAGVINRFAYGRQSAEFLYLAAGGAWTFTARDGEASDADGRADDRSTVDLARLRRLGGSGPDTPLAFTPGGVLLIIDPARLDLTELRIDAATLGEVR